MNKLFSKIIGASLAIAMMIGAAVGVYSNREAKEVNADDPSTTMTWSSGAFTFSDDGDSYLDFSCTEASVQNDDLRLYAGNEFTISAKSTYAESLKIKKLVVTGKSSKNSNVLYYDTETGTKVNTGYEEALWNTTTSDKTMLFGDGFNSITVWRASSGNQVRVTKIVVTYEIVASEVTEASEISITPTTPTTIYAGESVSFTASLIGGSGAYEKTISWTSNNGDVIAAPSDSEDGESVTVTATNSIASQTTVRLTGTVVNPGSATGYIDIVVKPARTISSIELHGTIAKTNYYVGESWDLDGLDIQVNWSEGNPTFVNLDDADVDYECTPATAISTSIDSFDLTVMYAEFYETFPVDGLTVAEHPKTDVLTDAVIGVQSASYTSSWAEISNVQDYTGAKYMFRTMKPTAGNGYTMNTNSNGYMVTTYCPGGVKLKSISFSFLTNGKNLAIYASNTAYTAGTAPSATSVGTVSGTGSSASFDFSTLETEYRYVAFKGTGTSTIVGTVTVEYEELIPEVTASPTSIDLATGLTRTVEITANKFINTPALTCNVISGASYISNASVGAVNNENKATLTVEASNQSGTAVVRVSAVQNLTTYYADVTVNVLESTKSIIENNVVSKASLSFKYTKHGIADTLTAASINNTGANYVNWADRAGDTTNAVYAGNSYGPKTTAIQLRSDTNSSGIVTTTSGGTATAVKVVWDGGTPNGRTLEVYGKNSPYSDASDLYDDEAKGTLIGTIVNGTSTSLQLTGNYTFIGVRSHNGALYLTSLEIEWGATYDYSNVAIRFGGYINQTLWNDLNTSSVIEGYGVMISTSNSIKNRYNAVKESEGSIDATFEAVQGQSYKLVKGTDIRTFYNTTSVSPAVQGDNYFWNLYQRINYAPEDINRTYTAVAFIRTTNDGLVFLGEISESAVQLAGETVANNPNENAVSEGSLAYFAGLTL